MGCFWKKNGLDGSLRRRIYVLLCSSESFIRQGARPAKMLLQQKSDSHNM